MQIVAIKCPVAVPLALDFIIWFLLYLPALSTGTWELELKCWYCQIDCVLPIYIWWFIHSCCLTRLFNPLSFIVSCICSPLFLFNFMVVGSYVLGEFSGLQHSSGYVYILNVSCLMRLLHQLHLTIWILRANLPWWVWWLPGYQLFCFHLS